MANGALSSAGLAFIARWEGYRGRLYNDAAGHCTIGYGHLVHLGRCNGSEPPVFLDGITTKEGLDLLNRDASKAVRSVNAEVVVPLTQHKFDALVSFAFNVGPQAFADSTLLKKVNLGQHKLVPAQMALWTNHGLPGLVNRRRAEAKLYVQGDYQ